MHLLDWYSIRQRQIFYNYHTTKESIASYDWVQGFPQWGDWWIPLSQLCPPPSRPCPTQKFPAVFPIVSEQYLIVKNPPPSQPPRKTLRHAG